jgi:hypothetical protein
MVGEMIPTRITTDTRALRTRRSLYSPVVDFEDFISHFPKRIGSLEVREVWAGEVL